MTLISDWLGATYLGNDQCAFRVWAPKVDKVEVHFTKPKDRVAPLQRTDAGYHTGVIDAVPPGSRYCYRLNARAELPDPASRFQPEGVHKPSAVVDQSFDWHDRGWFGLPLRDYIIYELHVGTFTREGTFDAVIPHLESLKDLGITAVEIMPVAQFPGTRNWGYDGVYLWAVQDSYGGPGGLKRLVDACHQTGLCAILDVVYNHLGPEGNYLGEFGPYFTGRYQTPWGAAINFDGAYSDDVRRYFIENALYWQTEFHFDALRLDAVHAICDFAPTPFLEELAVAAQAQSEILNRRFHLIAESDLNNARLIMPRTIGGYGLDAQWSDDFHHSLHALLTGEQSGYYEDFGGLKPLARFFRHGYTYINDYSKHRKRRHGNSPRLTTARQFVVCIQNHDQVGNRATGDRLSATLSFEELKLAASTILLSPFVPMLFMGEEYGETAPFQYFTSHSDPALIKAVREGRAREFEAFQWQGEVPDPHDEKTFQRSKLNHDLAGQKHHRVLREFHGELIRLRKELPAIARAEKETTHVVEHEADEVLAVRYASAADQALLLLCFKKEPVSVTAAVPQGLWRKRLDSAAERWHGPGGKAPEQIESNGTVSLKLAPRSALLYYQRSGEVTP